MRYRGPRSNWVPIIVTIAVVVVALVVLYFLFLAPKPAGSSPTSTPFRTPVPTSS